MKTITHYTSGPAVSHLAHCLGAGHADFRLLFHLKGSQMGALRLLVHRVLTLLALHPQAFGVILCVGLGPGGSHIPSDLHQLTISLAGLIDFNGADINARDSDAKIFFEPLAESVLYLIVDQGDFAFHLDQWDIVGSRCVGHDVLDLAAARIQTLLLETI